MEVVKSRACGGTRQGEVAFGLLLFIKMEADNEILLLSICSAGHIWKLMIQILFQSALDNSLSDIGSSRDVVSS